MGRCFFSIRCRQPFLRFQLAFYLQLWFLLSLVCQWTLRALPVSQKISVSWRREIQIKCVWTDCCCHCQKMTIILTLLFWHCWEWGCTKVPQQLVENKWLIPALKGYLSRCPPARRLCALLTEEQVGCCNHLMAVMLQVDLESWGNILRKKIWL